MFCNVQNNYRLRDFDPFNAEQEKKKKKKKKKSRQSTCTILTGPTSHRTEVAPVKSSDTFSICTDFQLQKMH